jgi:hypothetical protein
LGTYDHANLQAALVVWFRTSEREWNIRAVPELRVPVSPTRYRVPDVTVIDRAQQEMPLAERFIGGFSGSWTG